MTIKKIYLDMDGTLAKFYEKDTCLEDMYNSGFFEGLNPYTCMLDTFEKINKRVKNVEIYILSACVTAQCKKEKLEWLKKFMPWVKTENIILTSVGENKADAIGKIDENCFLIDDYSKNINDWESAGGIAIKAVNEINDKHKSWEGHRIDCFADSDKNYSHICKILQLN